MVPNAHRATSSIVGSARLTFGSPLHHRVSSPPVAERWLSTFEGLDNDEPSAMTSTPFKRDAVKISMHLRTWMGEVDRAT